MKSRALAVILPNGRTDRLAGEATGRRYLAKCRAFLSLVEPTIVPVVAVEQLTLPSTILEGPRIERSDAR